jgi:hypothetical protein
MASYRDCSGLGRMVKLAMAALLADLRPSVALDHSDGVPDCHEISISARPLCIDARTACDVASFLNHRRQDILPPMSVDERRFGSTHSREKIGQCLDNGDRFDADADYLADQADDIGGVVFTVGVGVAFHLVLIDDPVERGAGAQAVIEGPGWDVGQGQGFVD